MKNNIKVIYVDIDETLMNSKKEVSLFTKEVIKNTINNNIYVILSSGRNNKNVEKVSRSVLASNFIISSNGALAYNYETKEVLYEERINFDDIKEIWNFMLKHKIGCFINYVSGRYCNKYITVDNDNEYKYLDDIDNMKGENIYQLVVSCNNYKKSIKALRYIKNSKVVRVINLSKSLKYNIKRSSYYFIDIVSVNANKGNAVKFMTKYLNLDKNQTLCFGDHINDIEMFKECQYKVAVSNACEELKELATDITLSNDEDGVGIYIKDNV
ncbi:MAG: HAD family hydrolase [Bacilli bacterium]